MKKIFAIFGAATMLFACAKEINDSVTSVDGNQLSFKAAFDPSTKVTTSQGKSTWQAGDAISLFSVSSDAVPGESVSNNLSYTATSTGATTEFVKSSIDITASDKYYAFYPNSAAYPSKLNENAAVDFAGAAAGAAVNDYRFIPITVNTGDSFTYDPTTGKTKTDQCPYFYASAAAPQAGQAVNLVFKPILPVIEFGLKGIGTVKTVVIEYVDKTTDVLDNATNRWFTGKGVFDISTGVLTTTNTSSSGYCKMTVTLKSTDADYITLDPENPIYFNLQVGRFEVTKGFKLTFTDKDGGVTVKTIWTDKTYKGMTDAGQPKFISQVIYVGERISFDEDTYYEVDMSAIDWTESYVHHAKDADGNLLAVITKEFFGATQNKQGIVVYPAKFTTPDYTKGQVAQITLDGDAAPEGNVHGGTLNAWTTHAADVAYTAGTSAPISKMYVKGDGSEILTSAPQGEVKASALVPYTLSSTSGQIHPLVKIGERFWTACSYKTTQMLGNRNITQMTDITAGAPSSWAHGLYIDGDKWLYNTVVLGISNSSTPTYSNKIAPEGWTLPSRADWVTDLADYLGGTSSFANMSKALLFDRTSWQISGKTYKDLGYYSTWSCETPGTSKAMFMLLCRNGEAPNKSTQDWNKMYELRLVSVK